ncbi:putative disease resistance protein At3g14460 [Morus notabilis]|uniref:putative disease resistance protein At3g14460 n=1 Tax=Morus notabilis TaxID=981085 RepID=UPI000CED254B|nr:putative disease resistance protein At3g14460 [Morus notabilis]
MAELVAEAFLTVAFEKLFELLASPEFRSFFQGKKSIDDKLGLLNEKLKTASLLLNDAEDRQIIDQKVKEWLDDLKDVIFRADDLVEEIKAEARAKQESKSSTSALKKMVAILTPSTEFDKNVRGEIENILKDLSFLLERASTLCLKHIDRAQNIRSIQRSPAPLLEESHVHGRDDDKQEILKLLLSDEIWGNKIGVLPIVGMGGLGKTTLARLVYDDDRVKTHGFHHKAWVTVSTEFDIFKITKIILEQVSPQTPSSEEQAELQGRLKEALRGKKFLFVLDDVWDENYDNWDSLRSAFLSADSGSRIIVTTRSQKVASNVNTGGKIHQLLEVSNEDCWKIFVDHAFNGDSILDPRLQQIGEKIVEKCKGLPLAVRSVGGLLRSVRNPETWESILRNPVWSKNLRNNILPGLWLSYSCLSSSLKQCFAYCSIFPKDYEFEKEQIILLWMAEGFLQSDEKGKRMEEVGDEYFDELMARSIFQRSNQDESTFVMHDLVHDLAIFVSGEACFRVDDATNVEQASKKARYVSIEEESSELELWKGRFEAKHLRTFLSLEFHLSFDQELVKEVLKGERYLRVLSKLAATDFQTLNDSFCKLKHLRYLDLSGSEIEEIPCSICTLYNLQTLLLSRCEKLTWLPKDMGRLTHLRHLDTTNTPLKEMPPRMGNLKELQTLTDFILGKDGSGSRIQELEALQHLRGKLRISGLQNIDNNSDILKVHCLRDKEKLTELGLEWEGEVTDTIRAREALNALEPHKNLRNLIIDKYAGSNFPDWLGCSSFSKLKSISLRGNEYCSFLPPLGQLPSLRELVIKSFHGVEKIGDEFYNTCNSSSITPFQSLEILEFFDMKSWKEWSFIGRDGEEGKSFPRLKRLCIDGCPNLAGSLLPDCDTLETLGISESFRSMKTLPLDKFPKLKKLKLRACENLKELSVESPDAIETLYITDCNKLEFPRSRHYVHAKELSITLYYIKSLPLDYFPRLEELSLSSCQNLESLTFTERTSTAHESLINSLWINNCKNFRSLPEHMHRLLPSLSDLKMYHCPEIESFPEGGLPSSLNKLAIYNCCKLIGQHKHWDLQKLTSLTSLGIVGKKDIMLDSFPEGLLPSSLSFCVPRESSTP